MTALLAEQRSAVSARERTEVEIRRQLAEMSRRWAEAEREIADLQGKPPEQAAPPLQVAVLQLYPAEEVRGEKPKPAGGLEVPKDASIVTFNLASRKEIQASDRAILSPTADASVIARAGLLRQGSGHTVSFPTTKLEDGAYTLQLVRGTGREVVETYNFRIRRVTVSQDPPQE
jgi:hypothetical protein